MLLILFSLVDFMVPPATRHIFSWISIYKFDCEDKYLEFPRDSCHGVTYYDCYQ